MNIQFQSSLATATLLTTFRNKLGQGYTDKYGWHSRGRVMLMSIPIGDVDVNTSFGAYANK
jgi:hypothetical protein